MSATAAKHTMLVGMDSTRPGDNVVSTDFTDSHQHLDASVVSPDSIGQKSVQVVEPDSEVRRLLKDRQMSNLRKYKLLMVGDRSFVWLAYYELVMLFGSFPGIVGLTLRHCLYPTLLKKCGKGVAFGRNVTIRHPQRICIGDNVVIDDNAVLDAKGEADTTIEIESGVIVGRNSSLVCKGGTIHLAENANISLNCTIISESEVTIGQKSLIGGHCYIIGGGNHGVEMKGIPFVDQPRSQHGGVHILANCWLGASATVLDGTCIGPNAIVGAGAVVNRDVQEKTIVAGVPATLISTQSKSLRRHAH